MNGIEIGGGVALSLDEYRTLALIAAEGPARGHVRCVLEVEVLRRTVSGSVCSATGTTPRGRL